MTGRTRVVYADASPLESLEFEPAVDGGDGEVATTVVADVRDCLEALPSADCVVVGSVTDASPVELCERIRARSDVPIVAFPADGSEVLAGEIVAAGADAYVPRAQGTETLSRRIRDVLDERANGVSSRTGTEGGTETTPASAHTAHGSHDLPTTSAANPESGLGAGSSRSRPGPETATPETRRAFESLESAVVLDPGTSPDPDLDPDPDTHHDTHHDAAPRVDEAEPLVDAGSECSQPRDDLLHRFIDGLPLAVVEWNREFEAVGWSAAATDLFGYGPADALGRSAFELVVPSSEREALHEYWNDLVEGACGRGPSTRLNRNRRADGTTIVCEWVNIPIVEDGEVVGVLSYARDVSDEHKRAAVLESLQETSHELIRAESAGDIATIAMEATESVLEQPLGAIRFYDRETDRLELEATTSALAAHGGDDASIAPEDELWTAYVNDNPTVLENVPLEEVATAFDVDPDSAVDVSIGDAIFHPLGDHGLLAIASTVPDRLDPTDIHLVSVLAATVEAALDRTIRNRELARAETIVEAVGDGVYALDEEGRFVTVNDRLADLTGHDRDELLGDHVSTILTDESASRRRKRVRALSSAGNDGIATYEATLETTSGELVPCEINTTLWQPDEGGHRTVEGDSDSEADGRGGVDPNLDPSLHPDRGTAAGTTTGTVGIVRDVTDRKRMQRQIIDQKAKIESLHSVASRLDDCDGRGEICDLAVEAAEDVLNFDACAIYLADEDDDSLVRRALSSKVDERYEPRIPLDKGIAGRTYCDGRTYRLEDVTDHDEAKPATEAFRAGLSVPIGDRGVFQAASTERAAFTDDDKELAELLLSHVSDALDRLVIEEELRTERDRFAALFENVPDAVVSSRYVEEEASPVVESINPAFERVFGYEESELLGESIDDYIVPTGHEDEANLINRAGSQGESIEKEVKRRTADGLRDFMLRIAPMETDGFSERTFGVYTDITERKQHRKRVEILNRVLRHDLRNGMNIIDGCAQLLLDELEKLDELEEVEATGGGDDTDTDTDTDTDSGSDSGSRPGPGSEPENEPEHDDYDHDESLEIQGREYARTIQERANELIDLAEKTRGVERTLDRDDTTTNVVDLVDLVTNAVERLEREYAAADASSSLPDSCVARGTEFLETALFQLLENAVEHNDGEHPSVDVTVTDAPDDEMVRVSIADDGPGIPTEERELLQEDREITQLRHASGLGLWLVNWVVTHSGGRLSFEDRDAGGTIVRIELPRADRDHEPASDLSGEAGTLRLEDEE
ncbi:PAS domain S-box protein [Halobiforma nitratireducens]|uniref:PAS sensor protein n=1 Tax=Halobiforma nitratireducens JCM 10879 TaxID=1227454 RepID=M0LGG0_9EURY|nr:PAS domain S-box protein [Halobiforma nitratireducens]EMA31070.1 PAS sensor protein [Halobiforma nitratireducens JCM 10879]